MQTGRGQTIVHLETGQLIWGRKAAGSQLRMKPKSAENRMLRLVHMGNLARHVDTHWTVLSVVNWATYNGHPAESGQATGQAMARQWPGNGQAMATLEEVKKERSEESSSSAREDLEPVDIPLASGGAMMMMLSTDADKLQKDAMSGLLSDIFRDPAGLLVVNAVVGAFNKRAVDGKRIVYPVSYVGTLADDIGPRIRREAQQDADQQAVDTERTQERWEWEEEQESKRTDPAAFAQAVTNHERRARRFAKHDVPTVERTETAAVLCRTLGIEQPPVGWDSVEA